MRVDGDEALNEHTRWLLQLTYEDLVERKVKPTAKAVFQRAWQFNTYARDAEVERWMEMTLECVPAGRLRYLYDRVLDLLCEQCLYNGGCPGEDDDPAPFVAAGLATLRWRFRENAGRTPEFVCSVAATGRWLKDSVMPPPKVRGQLGLFT